MTNKFGWRITTVIGERNWVCPKGKNFSKAQNGFQGAYWEQQGSAWVLSPQTSLFSSSPLEDFLVSPCPCPWYFRDVDTTLSSWFQKSWPLTNFITFCLWSSFGQKCLNSFCRSWSGHHLSAKAWLHHPVLWQEEALCHRSMLHPHYSFVKISFHNNACQIISSTSQGSRFVVLALGHLSLHHSLKCKTNLSQSLFVQLTKSMASALFVCILRNLLWSSFILFSSWRLLTNAEGDWQSVLHLLGDLNIFCRCW